MSPAFAKARGTIMSQSLVVKKLWPRLNFYFHHRVTERQVKNYVPLPFNISLEQSVERQTWDRGVKGSLMWTECLVGFFYTLTLVPKTWMCILVPVEFAAMFVLNFKTLKSLKLEVIWGSIVIANHWRTKIWLHTYRYLTWDITKL